jgi:hypothetical protein
MTHHPGASIMTRESWSRHIRTTPMNVDLQRWIERPRRTVNIAAAMATGLMMVVMFAASLQMPEPALFRRGVALLLIMVHCLLHLASLAGLRALVRHDVDGAARALAIYTDPWRISHLDQAVAWVGFLAVAPHL